MVLLLTLRLRLCHYRRLHDDLSERQTRALCRRLRRASEAEELRSSPLRAGPERLDEQQLLVEVVRAALSVISCALVLVLAKSQ